METEINTPGYEDLELSTQVLIKEALRREARVEVLDRQESFIVITKGRQREYIKQATRTSLDTYIGPLIMENKLVTKEILSREQIAVPLGQAYTESDSALADFSRFEGKDIVVKPKSTNFGIAVTILGNCTAAADFEQAVGLAFAEDCTVLVEEYVHGKEYRFLVIGDQVNAVLHRVPANVRGDGEHAIRDLVAIKNENPLRGTGYTRPLEKIKLSPVELQFLTLQGKNFDSVPDVEEIVYLRSNSNISTGGDSIDCTDEMHPGYKDIALAATRAVGAVLNGADIIIEDIRQPPATGNHSVIELNFNPAIHIHCYPYQGQNRHPERIILDMLGF